MNVLRLLIAPATLACAAQAIAQQPAIDPIAESNRLTNSSRASILESPTLEAPWLMPSASRVPPPPHLQTPVSPAVGRTVISIPVTWTAPQRQSPIQNRLPTSDRPMIPCEPCEPPPPAPVCEQPKIEIPTPVEVLKCTPVAPAVAPVQSVSMCRFADLPNPKKPEPDSIIAVVRRGGSPVGNVAEIRKAVEIACQNRVEDCQTEVAGERQVRVMMTVRTLEEWQQLYAGLQDLPELGEYGLVFQVRIKPQ